MARRSKIVCTLGPASDAPRVLAAMVASGMDVARLNFSHGSAAEHRGRAEAVRRESRRAGRNVAILQDLQGPKLRLGVFAEGRVELVAGESVLLVTRRGVVGSPRLIPVPLPSLARDCSAGDPVLLDDGRVRLRVRRRRGADVEAEVEVGGPISDHKGVSLPGAAVSVPAFTPKDRRDAALGRALGVDLVAMSFVRTAQDVERARRHLAPGTPLIAKMEKPQAIEAMEEIVRSADGVMVARGDLGVELPLEQVPGIQKRLVHRANVLGRTCIVATEMLESMIRSPRPTRAEVSDVANAVLDGADAVMLSAETAVGHDPVAAVATMARIIEEAERGMPPAVRPELAGGDISPGIAAAAVEAARSVGAKVIVAYTESGYTARLVAAFRPAMPILALTPNDAVVHRLALVWGVEAHQVPRLRSTDTVMQRARDEVRRRGLAIQGERIAIVAGVPLNEPGNTN
ncbi:MAG: pyruvate kinase, partial [Myxococcaceae bacterium]